MTNCHGCALVPTVFLAADTSALVALSSIGRLDLLRRIWAEVWLPPAVVRELITDGAGWVNARQAQVEFAKGDWLRPWTKEIACITPPSRKLGAGEIEVVSLARIMRGTCFMDDGRGRSFAESVGVTAVGVPGVLCRSKRDQVIPAVKPLLLEMQRLGIRYSHDLIAKVLADMNE